MQEASVRDSVAAVSPIWLPWTIDSVFASAERDLQDPERNITRLELDPKYGFPRRVESDSPGVSDSWKHIEVRRFKPHVGRPSRPST
jgi:hypothetical protein